MSPETLTPAPYLDIQAGIVAPLESARTAAARSINVLMTASYWEIGRRIVTFEQGGEQRGEYGEALIRHLATDLTRRFGRGFSERNLEQMRKFYLSRPIPQTPSAEFTDLASMASRFPLPWSAYACLLSVRDPAARAFYETEALRGGWSVRQLDRQVNSMLYERTAPSRNKAAMLEQGSLAKPSDRMTPEEAIKDPFVLEFLDLNDQYSETDMETALIQHLAEFLLELGDGFTFVGRFSHADAGQMHLYLNYAREHWMCEGENPPVGLILCAAKGAEEARYALDNLPNKVLAAEYRMVLPDARRLATELERTRREIEARLRPTLPEPSRPAPRTEVPIHESQSPN